MDVTVTPVDLELSMGAVGDSRKSVAEASKLDITGAALWAARAPSVLAVLSPCVGGAWRTGMNGQVEGQAAWCQVELYSL